MNVAILMDSPESLHIYKDTTLAMIHSALTRNLGCYVFGMRDLRTRNGKVSALLSKVKRISLTRAPALELAEPKEQELGDMDFVLMRKDPPFDSEYIYATYALELAEAAGARVINRPASLRDANEKYFTMRFPQCCPESLVTRDTRALKAFWEAHRDVVYKPLTGMGGRSVFRVGQDGANLSVILETLTQSGEETIMVQRYLPEIREGDTRVLVVHGKAIPFGLSRIPAEDDFRGNLAAGATGKVRALRPRDYELVEQIAPTLLSMGLYYVGLDVIGDFVTEINVTSPTCSREIETATGVDSTAIFWDGLL